MNLRLLFGYFFFGSSIIIGSGTYSEHNIGLTLLVQFVLALGVLFLSTDKKGA